MLMIMMMKGKEQLAIYFGLLLVTYTNDTTTVKGKELLTKSPAYGRAEGRVATVKLNIKICPIH